MLLVDEIDEQWTNSTRLPCHPWFASCMLWPEATTQDRLDRDDVGLASGQGSALTRAATTR